VTNAPSWSPDSRRIAFAANVECSQYDVYSIGADGKDLRRLTVTTEDSFDPAWSPDGTTIAYSEAGAIYAVPAQGGEARRLTDADNNDSSPGWNPRPPSDES
jgi:Tol biopolymer transport system component